jgi:nicotinate-nucleotide pyrophosphorylase (carboxylating)
LAKEDFIVCGLEVFKYVFLSLDNNIEIDLRFLDGEKVLKGDDIATLSGNARALLSGERVALNILQRLSGIATLTSKFVEKVPPSIKILDTRKTTPGLRTLEKYAVQCGGGANHRFGLYDAILIKDNHIKAAGSITKAVEMALAKFPNILKIEVEVKNIVEVQEALLTPCNILLLDNMSPDDIQKAVNINNKKAKIEVSGNVTLGNIHKIVKRGIDFISVGALTHSAQAVDISMIIE